MKRFTRPLLALAVAALGCGPARALDFELTFLPGTTPIEQQSFAAAAAWWSSVLSDPVTVRLTVGTASLSGNVVASAGSRRLTLPFEQVRDALVADASSDLDQRAVANLSPGSSFGMLINLTADSPTGFGSSVPYLDDDGSFNNSSIALTAANARALGIAFAPGGVGSTCSNCDGYITFRSGLVWDHDRSDGIAPNAYDFIGIATHEIGHSLGFISGVDTLDFFSPDGVGTALAANQLPFVSTLDLFRWSAASAAAGVIDWTADNRDKYFSVERGADIGPWFANGVNNGDGLQASHWRDGLGLGIMDPTVARGELLQIGPNDLMALDAIGWAVTPVPEPSPALMAAAGLLALAWRRRAARG